MRIAGKQSLIIVVPLLALLASFGLVTFVYQEAEITYEVELTSIHSDNVYIWGNVQLTITNGRDSVIGFTDISVDLIDPKTEEVFYTYTNDGGTLNAGESIKHSIDFKVLIDDLPEREIRVIIIGWLLWDGETTLQERTFEIPVEIEI